MIHELKYWTLYPFNIDKNRSYTILLDTWSIIYMHIYKLDRNLVDGKLDICTFINFIVI